MLTRAQKDHIEQGEPIPAINKQGQGIIEYCLEAPFKGIENIEYYPSFDCKAAVLFYDICKLHALSNGNKRMAVEATVYFAFKNNYIFVIEKDDMINTAKKVVQSDPDNKEQTIIELSEVFKSGMVYLTRFDRFRIIITNFSSIYKILLRILFTRIAIFFGLKKRH